MSIVNGGASSTWSPCLPSTVPPFIIDIGHIDEIVNKLDKAVRTTLSAL